MRQRRAVVFLYGAISAALLLVIATVALVVVPPSPPGLAEYAPSAVDSIDDAPEGQASQFGAGDGDCPAGLVCDPVTGQAISRATPRPGTVERARVRRCVGDPPRQIEDPQSPPCVNYWEGDNGGATSKGVTRNEIRVAWPTYTSAIEPVVDTLVNFFNRRFEFYGRQIRLVKYSTRARAEPTEMRATAGKIDQELDAFAAFGYPGVTLHTQAFYDELARRGVIGVDASMTFNTEQEGYGRNGPYQWGYLTSLDKYQRNQAEWFCKGLADRPAGFAGPEFQTVLRKAGVVTVRYPGGAADASVFADGVTSCTDAAVETVEIAHRADESEMTTALASLRGYGVTSITCYCDGNELSGLMEAASQMGYFPEWLLNGFFGQDDDVFARGQPPEQRSHAFGLTAKNKFNRHYDSPWYWATTEQDSTYASDDYGSPGTSGNPAVYVPSHYQTLLVLASGIQMAGPRLTPDTFEKALMETVFPNPRTGSAPYYQGRVGFGPNDHTMIQDLAMIWYDESAESYGGAGRELGRGSYCYVDLGKRYGLGQWPTQTPAYFDRTAPCK